MSALEPESVKAMVAQMKQASNGHLNDEQLVLKIYADFRYGIKHASMIGHVTYADIDVLIDAAIKRIRKQVKDEVIRAHAIALFVNAKAKLAGMVEDDVMRADICSLHDLPKFLCPCKKD